MADFKLQGSWRSGNRSALPTSPHPRRRLSINTDNCATLTLWYKTSGSPIADGASLKGVLDHLCASIDVQVSPSVATVFLMDADGKHLVLTGGPRVPAQWISAVSPRPVTQDCGLCGKAAFSKRRVIVADVATDPGWPDEYRELALSNGIRAAWSEPILTKDN